MRKEFAGSTFGRWTVLNDEPNDKNGARMVRCQCSCGSVKVIHLGGLLRGLTKSCGCAKAALMSAAFSTHRLSHSRIWNIWQNMRTRCYNQNSSDYPNYGGRGIIVCERWRSSVENFLADMGQPPPGWTLDRIDSNGNYEPGNCRWATRAEQNRNTRRNRYVDVDGITMTVAEAARLKGVNRTTVEQRLSKGWSTEAALTPI